jgi:UDP:flavonoid glycosyltransferase YjiC (YdhE family)
MHFAFCAHGSNGDVLPLLAIAERMKSNGHRATLLADHGFQTQAAACNVDYIPITTSAQQNRILKDRTLLTTRYAELYMTRHVVSWNQTAFEALSRMPADDLIIVAAERPNLWADLELRRHTPVKIVRALIDLPPISSLQPRRLPETGIQRTLRTRTNSAWASYLAAHGRSASTDDRFAIYRTVRPSIPTVALWPAWIAGGPILKAFRATFGFMPVPEFAPALNETRQGHIVFYPGTAGTTDGWLPPYLNTAAAACERIGRPGVVIGASGGRLTAIKFAPLMELLRGASAIVHHGGIGTAAAALESGVPQIVIPRIFNQPSNAEWLRRLGVCQVVKPGKWNPDTATQHLLNAMQNEAMMTQAAHIAAKVNRKAALDDLCNFLENPSNY